MENKNNTKLVSTIKKEMKKPINNSTNLNKIKDKAAKKAILQTKKKLPKKKTPPELDLILDLEKIPEEETNKTHCKFPSCTQKHYNSIECHHCKIKHCPLHFHPMYHACESPKFIKIRSFAKLKRKKKLKIKCGVKNCKKVATKVRCKKCKKLFCSKHQQNVKHGCKSSPSKQKPEKPKGGRISNIRRNNTSNNRMNNTQGMNFQIPNGRRGNQNRGNQSSRRAQRNTAYAGNMRNQRNSQRSFGGENQSQYQRNFRNQRSSVRGGEQGNGYPGYY